MKSYRFQPLIIIGFIILWLTGCGGDHGNPTFSPSLDVDRKTIHITAIEDRQTIETVRVKLWGNLDVTWYGVYVHDNNGSIVSAKFENSTSTDPGYLVIRFASGNALGQGTYTNKITVVACYDQNCNRHLDNSPVTINTRWRYYIDDGNTFLNWEKNVFRSENNYAHRCETPRTGTNPATGEAYLDVAGSVLYENFFLRSWSNNTYLWYSEIDDQDPHNFNNTLDYFDVLKTTALTPSGNAKDRYHFTTSSETFFDQSQSGVSAGYGLQWALLSPYPPREILVAYTEPDSPSINAAMNMKRGIRVLEIDGIDVVNSNDTTEIQRLNEALYPSAVNKTHQLVVQDIGATTTREVTLTSANITASPVQQVKVIPTATGNVGYFLFNAHIATAEAALISAIQTLSQQGITDLVIDLRYNGGGLLNLASELAYMVAGDEQTDGKIFEKLRFNNKHQTVNPVSGQVIQPIPFFKTALGYSATPDTALPTLDLPRLFVLTGENTCSASEAVINSLRGIDVEVIQIGNTTCGKPYGFYPTDNCGTTYFTVQFSGTNHKGFGDYPDGFSPANSGTTSSTRLPGCTVEDDFSHTLGDIAESRLAAALYFQNHNSCPQQTSARSTDATGPVILPKPQWMRNRLIDQTTRMR